jgi:glycosyltransferase involved in cell wall biosynthesis
MIAYNHEGFISEAINGVMMQQTNFPIELVIGEDCSTDNTRKICLEYKEKYPDKIRLLLPESNLGMMNNFLQTLRACTGKYIALCEGDDYWTDPYKLQKQVDFLEKNEKYGMVYTNCKIYYQTECKYDSIKFNESIDCDLTFYDELKENKIQTLTTCFRKYLIDDFLLEIYSLEMGWMMGDYPLFLYVASKTMIRYLSDITGVYRVLDESAFHSKDCLYNLKFSLSVLQIREFFALREKKIYLINEQLSLSYYDVFEFLYINQIVGVLNDILKIKLSQYCDLSYLNKIRLWGLKNKFNYCFSKFIIRIYKFSVNAYCEFK